MIGRNGFDSRPSGTGRAPAAAPATAARLDRLVAQARAADPVGAGLAGALARPGVGLLFLVLSWSGLWLDLPPLWRQIGLGVLGRPPVAALCR